ncbi:hypothetical protein CBM2633_B60231 [Cupriavidus taiwanensis]|nr:hypothetical protein CBM2633_B60231 [Cupriavidus taiwanensis]
MWALPGRSSSTIFRNGGATCPARTGGIPAGRQHHRRQGSPAVRESRQLSVHPGAWFAGRARNDPAWQGHRGTDLEASGGRFPVTVQSIPGDGKRVQAHLTLSDGNPLTIDVHPRMTPIAERLPNVLVLQLLLLIACCCLPCGWPFARWWRWPMPPMRSTRTQNRRPSTKTGRRNWLARRGLSMP